MARLAVDERAFIRPSPTSGTLGGVASATREAMVIVEAAGFNVVLVETVGVGQSETAVANMTDCFLVLMLARTGDALQGIKKGVLELADVLAVNKADGPHEIEAKAAARELAKALALIRPPDAVWVPPVLTCSAVHGVGIDEVWSAIEQHGRVMEEAGLLESRRVRQQIAWMWAAVEDHLISDFRRRESVQAEAARLEEQIAAGQITATAAARALLAKRP